MKAPFVKVEATKFTEVGYVGRDVDSMVRDLVEAAIRLPNSQDYRKNMILQKKSQKKNYRSDYTWRQKEKRKQTEQPV